MATYLAGLTDQVLPPVLYTPNWNMMLTEISQATSNWQQNKQALEDLWTEYFNTPVTNPISEYHRRQFKDSIDKKVKELENYNLGDISVLNSISDTIGEISNLLHVTNDIKQTKALNDFAKNLEVSKFAVPSKDNSYLSYNPKQLEHIEKQKFILSRADNIDDIANFKAYFPVHKDMDMIINDFAKEHNAEIVHSDFLFGDEKYKNLLGESVTPKYIVKTKNGIMTIPEWHQFVHRYLEENHNYSEQETWLEEAKIHQRIKEIDPLNFKTLNLQKYNELSKTFLFQDIHEERKKLDEIEKTEKDTLDVLRQKKDKLNVELQEETDKIKNYGTFKGTDFVRIKEITEEIKRVDEMINRLETEGTKQKSEEINKLLDKFYSENLEKNKKNKDKKKPEEVTLTESQQKKIEELRQERDKELLKHITKDKTVTFQDLLNIYRNIRSYTGTYDIAKDYAMTHFAQKVTEDQFALSQLRKRPIGGGGSSEPRPSKLEDFHVDFQYTKVSHENATTYGNVVAVDKRKVDAPLGTAEAVFKEANLDINKKDKMIIIKSSWDASDPIAKSYVSGLADLGTNVDIASANVTQKNSASTQTVKGQSVQNQYHPVLKIDDKGNLYLSVASGERGATYQFVGVSQSYVDGGLAKRGNKSIYAIGYANKGDDKFLKYSTDNGKTIYSIVQPDFTQQKFVVHQTTYDDNGNLKEDKELYTIWYGKRTVKEGNVTKEETGYFVNSLSNKTDKTNQTKDIQGQYSTSKAKSDTASTSMVKMNSSYINIIGTYKE